MRSNWAFILLLALWTSFVPEPTWTGHTMIWAPIKIKLPMSALVGLAATKVASLSLVTSVLAKGKLKLLKSPKRKSIFPIFKWPSITLPGFGSKKPPLPKMLPPVWLFPPGPIYPPGFQGPHFPPHRFGTEFGPSFRPGFGSGFGGGFGLGTGFHGIPVLLPPLPPPPPPRVPDFLKSKLVDPKDACILKMLCEFEFDPDKLGGGDLEKLVLGLAGGGGKKKQLSLNLARRRRRDIGDFWINIQKKDKDEKHGSELCENRYPTCFYSPIFSGSRLSILHRRRRRREVEHLPFSYAQGKFIEQVVERIWQLYRMIKLL